MKKAANSLEKSVRNLLTLPRRDSEDDKKYALMLIYALICKLEWMCENREPFEDCWQVYKEIMCLFEKFDNDQKISLAKYCVIRLILTYPIEKYDYNLLLEVLPHQTQSVNSLNANLESYEGKWKFWNGAEVFDVPFDEQSLTFLNYQDKHYSRNVIKKHIDAQETVIKTSMKQSAHELESMPKYYLIGQKLKSENRIENVEAMKMISDKVEHLLNLGYFRQAHHIISLGIYYSVKVRRSMPPEEKSTMNIVQGTLSANFASYGLMLINGMISEMEGNTPKRNDDFTELTDAIEDGLEIYASEFPVEYPSGQKGAKKVLKRAMLWIDRAMGLCKECPAKVEDFKATKGLIIFTMDTVNNYFSPL